MSWAETVKINSNMAKSLDTLITEQCAVKMQTVSFSHINPTFAGDVYEIESIDAVDVTKSIIIPTTTGSPARVMSGGSLKMATLSYEFQGNNAVKCTCSEPYTSFTASAVVITFGGNVTN